MRQTEKITDYDRFIGKWAVTFNNEQVSIEFHEQGRLTYTGLFGKDLVELMDECSKFTNPLFPSINKPIVPYWDLKNDKLIIFIKKTEELTFNYNFSDSNEKLTLTNKKGDCLIFTKQ